jgi:hypothetical protein
MSSRLPIAALFAAILAVPIGHAQQIASDVVISGASPDDGYGGAVCGVDGQVYRYPRSSKVKSVMRVSRDGSTLLFPFAKDEWPMAFASIDAGLNLLTLRDSKNEGRLYEMYRFDNQANLLSKHRLSINVHPLAIAVTFSGKTIVVGYHPENASMEDRKYGGAILDADDQVIERFKLPLPPGGGGWTFDSGLAAGDDVAYVMLYSNARSETEKSKSAIAMISGDGQLDIKNVPLPPDTEDRHHKKWLFGSGIAVEWYRYLGNVGERKRAFWGFDEYDLKTGERVGTRSTVPAGLHPGCYSGEELSLVAYSAPTDAERAVPQDVLRLVTVKLMDGLITH